MTIKVNGAGKSHAVALIDAGDYDETSAWSFDAEDGDKLLEADGTVGAAYKKTFLGRDSDEEADTKAAWKYPFAKDGKLYRSALNAIRSRAAQQDATAIFDAAGLLIEKLDKKTGKTEEGKKSDDGRASPFSIEKRAMAFSFAPSSLDEDARTVDMAISTGAPVKRSDWRDGDYMEELSLDPKAVRLERLNAGAPLIDSHDYWGGTRAVVGAIAPGSARIEGGELRAKAKFSRSEEGERVFQDVKDGVLRHVSVGYLTHKHEVDDTTSPPTHRATDWEPHEVSVVAIPADPKAGFRSLEPRRAPPAKKEPSMTTNAQAGAPAAETRAAPVLDQGAINAAVKAGIEADRARRAGILETTRKLGLPDAFAETHAASDIALDAFRSVAIDEAAKLERSTPVASHHPGLYAPAYAPSAGKREPEPGERAARMLRAVAAGKKLSMSPIDVARTMWGDELTARALAAGIAASGGFMVPEELAAEVIDLLRPRTVVRKRARRILPMSNGNLSVPRINAGAAAGYVGENMPAPTGDEQFGQVRLSARKLMARVGISNDLIRFASPQADAVVRDDMVAQIAVAEDRAFLRGPGSQFSPKGMRNWAPAGNLIPSVALSFSVTTVISDCTSLVNALENANVKMIDPVWFMSQRTKNYLYDARDSVGGFLFRHEMDKGLFRGYPFEWTQSIPQNLAITLSGTTTANATELMLVDMADFVIGEVPGLIIDASQEATYTPDGVTLVSAFDNDQTVIRVIEQHDCAMRHDASVAVLTGVVWQ